MYTVAGLLPHAKIYNYYLLLYIKSTIKTLLVATPVSTLPTMSIGTFQAVAIRTQPKILGIKANLIVFSLPILSIRNPADIPPTGATITIALAENKILKSQTNPKHAFLTHQSMTIHFL